MPCIKINLHIKVITMLTIQGSVKNNRVDTYLLHRLAYTSQIWHVYAMPGLNLRPLDLQSDSHLLPDTLPTALHGPVT